MGFVHKTKLNLELPYSQANAAKTQGPCQERTLGHRLGSALSSDLCLQPAKAPSTLGTPDTADGPPHRPDFNIYYTTIML